jgi:hypothetical protein
VGDRTEQRDRHQTMDDQKSRRQTKTVFYVNGAALANGSAEPGR